MKIHIIKSLMLVGALSFASCTTQRLASNSVIEDDVYNTKARAGDTPDMPPPTYNQDVTSEEAAIGPDGQYYDSYGTGTSDYQYYDSYASRIDRFGYASPFNFYDDYYYTSPVYGGYYGYNGFGGAYGYGNPYGFGYGLGLGFGYGGYYGYAGGYPFGYGYGLGLGYGYGFGYPYGYSSIGIGYDGYPFWGVYSAYNRSTARPFRGSGAPGAAGLSSRGIGYNGRYGGVSAYPGRPVGTNGFGNRSTYSYGGNNGGYNNNGRPMRAPRTDYPGYQQPRTTNSFPSNNGNSGGGGRGGSPSGGGGGGRPGRP